MRETAPVFRDNALHVQAERCSTCVFHAGNRMHLREGRLAQLVAENLAADTALVCHETTFGQADEALCRGYVNAYGEQITAIRWARAMGCLHEVRP